MASSEYVLKIKEAVDLLLSLDKPKLLRPELGVESLEIILTPILDELYKKTNVMLQVSQFVSNSQVQTAAEHINAIHQNLATLIPLPNSEFVAQKLSVIANINSYVDTIRTVWSSFYVAYQENYPPTSSEQQSILEATKLTDDIKNKLTIADDTLKSFQTLLEEATRIREAAQNTAKGVSIMEAQNQFSTAQTNLYIKIIIASIGAAIFLYWFFYTAYQFLNEANDLKDFWTWKIAYHASIRAIILGAIGALSTFFLTLLKAYLHLLEHNSHRQRVANSTEAFVAAATTPEQRDLILGRLVDSVTTFGDSGLLKKESTENSPLSKFSFDIATKN